MFKNWFKKETKLVLTTTDDHGNIETRHITVTKGDSIEIKYTINFEAENIKASVTKVAKLHVV